MRQCCMNTIVYRVIKNIKYNNCAPPSSSYAPLNTDTGYGPACGYHRYIDVGRLTLSRTDSPRTGKWWGQILARDWFLAVVPEGSRLNCPSGGRLGRHSSRSADRTPGGREFATLCLIYSLHRVQPVAAGCIIGWDAALQLMQCPPYQYTGAHFADLRRMTG